MKDRFTFRIAAPDADESDAERFVQMLCKERPVMKDALDEDHLDPPKVEWCKPEDLEYNPRTGKLKVIIDNRK